MDRSTVDYAVSVHFDFRLYRQDITGSIAHVRMLSNQGIVQESDANLIIKGLEEIREDIEGGRFTWRNDLEDVHMNIERSLFDKIGSVAGMLHTARSRNDQVALDVRMYTKDVIDNVLSSLSNLRHKLVEKAETNKSVILPGYTHLQRAQPVLFAHHLLAYFEMFGRDIERFKQAKCRTDVMPLGSGALAGSPYPLDREFVANTLGFGSISNNSMDAVSDRDYIIDFQSASAVCAVHLSRLADEIVLWSSSEFGFITLDESHTSGSSMMPQKNNPDLAELTRGKTGRVLGNLVSLFTILKGLPLTYNRDLQEDKEGLFDTVDTIVPSLNVMSAMIEGMDVDDQRMRDAAENSQSIATDIADYLVKKGIPFREAHGIVAELSLYASEKGSKFSELTLETYRNFSPLFDSDVFLMSADSSVESRNVPGGTSLTQVEGALENARASLEIDVD